jgi:tetratricopeptide (TPR) repeat protein
MIPTYLGANPLLGITSGSWKYIRTTGAEFYDLKTDPRENVNLILQQQKRARMYDGALREILREHNPAATASNRVKQKTETLAKLTSLGYVGAEVSADSFSVNMDRADPKELIGLHMTLQRVQELKFAGSYGEAKQILEDRLIRESHFKLYEQLGEIAMREQNLGQAAEYYSQTLELNRDNYQANLNLGFILVKTGKVQQAADYFKKALSIRPQDIDALRNLGIVFEKTGRPEEACRYFEKVLALEPRDNAALNHLGTIHLHQGKEQEAQRYLTESLKHNPGQPLVLAQLSQVKTMRRDSSCYDPAGAVPLAAEACRLTNFKEPGLLYVLASAYARSGKRTEALKTAQQALRLAETGENRLLTQQIEGLIRFLKKNNPSVPEK